MNVWGYWKCPYCGETVRADHKDCTKCGTSIPNDVKFFMDTSKPIEYVDKEDENDEANWLCSYCRCQNPAKNTVCENCGAKRETAKGTYEVPKPKPQKRTSISMPKKNHAVWFLLAALLLIGIACVWYFAPVTREGEVVGFEWERSIAVEQYQKCRESDWTVPGGGSVVSSNREIRSYRKVLDHYEYKTKRVSKRVQDGYSVEYKDLGNGQFKEVRKPKYKTVYENQKVREPVYRQEPIYDTKYYYDIDRWKVVSNLRTRGEDQSPQWAETDLAKSVQSPKYGDKRQGARTETYWVVIKSESGSENKIEYQYDKWKDLKAGDKISYMSRRYSDDPL